MDGLTALGAEDGGGVAGGGIPLALTTPDGAELARVPLTALVVTASAHIDQRGRLSESWALLCLTRMLQAGLAKAWSQLVGNMLRYI